MSAFDVVCAVDGSVAMADALFSFITRRFSLFERSKIVIFTVVQR